MNARHLVDQSIARDPILRIASLTKIYRRTQIMRCVSIALASLVLCLPTVAVAAPVVFEASGASPADIQAAVTISGQFWAITTAWAVHFPMAVELTGCLCQTPSQRRTISRLTSSTRTRRVARLLYPRDGFQLSADSDNPTSTAVRYGNIHPRSPMFSAPSVRSGSSPHWTATSLNALLYLAPHRVRRSSGLARCSPMSATDIVRSRILRR